MQISKLFSKNGGVLPAVIKGINIIMWVYLFFVLGYSTFTKIPILELEWFDSQWWILLLVLNISLNDK